MRRRWLHGPLASALGIVTLLTWSGAARAELNVGSLTTAQVTALLASPGVTISNVTLSPAAAAATSSFSNGTSVLLGLNQGVVLSSGLASAAVGPNDDDVASDEGVWATVGDAQLSTLLGSDTADASVLEFNVLCPSGITSLTLEYVFASEEYEGDEFGLPDGLGIFIGNVNGSGSVNAATVPGVVPATPVHTNSLNGLETPALFTDNSSNSCYEDLSCPYNLQADGFSVKLQATAAIPSGVPRRVKIVIGDVGGPDGDSWVFVGPVVCGAPTTPPRVPLFGATPALLGLGSALLALASVVAGRRTRRPLS